MTSHTPARFTGCPALHRGSRTVCASPHSHSQTHDLRVHRPAAEVSRLYTSAHYHAAPTAYGSVPTHQIRLEDILSLPWALRAPSPGGPSSGGDLFGTAQFIQKAWLWGPHRHTGSWMSVPLGLDWRLAAASPSGCQRHWCTAWGPRNVASFPPSRV